MVLITYHYPSNIKKDLSVAHGLRSYNSFFPVIWPRPEYQVWLNTLHGGIQSVLLDEICGWVVVRKLQTSGVTSKMETRFRKPVSTTDFHVVLRGFHTPAAVIFVITKLYTKCRGVLGGKSLTSLSRGEGLIIWALIIIQTLLWLFLVSLFGGWHFITN